MPCLLVESILFRWVCFKNIPLVVGKQLVGQIPGFYPIPIPILTWRILVALCKIDVKLFGNSSLKMTQNQFKSTLRPFRSQLQYLGEPTHLWLSFGYPSLHQSLDIQRRFNAPDTFPPRLAGPASRKSLARCPSGVRHAWATPPDVQSRGVDVAADCGDDDMTMIEITDTYGKWSVNIVMKYITRLQWNRG